MSSLRVVRHRDPAAFLRRAEEWLVQSESEHTLVLGLASALVQSTEGYEAPLYFATVERGPDLVGCAFRTPPFKLGVTRMPRAAVELVAQDVGLVYDALPAVLGPIEVAEAFGEAWTALKGGRAVPGVRQGIHELTRVRFPDPMASGAMRLARESDVPLLIPWVGSFLEDTGLRGAGSPEPLTRHLTRSRLLALWVDDGPVSMAGFPARSRNGVRVGYVYTPAEHRGRGYASALVAHVSQHILDSGYRHCCLYTDLGNPTPNKIYGEIGYELVSEVMDVDFP